MPVRLDPDSFGFVLADVARLVRLETDRRVAEAGLDLTQGEGRMLAHVARAGTVRQAVLAERMGIEAMTVSSHLDRLEARGLLRRMPDPTDRRAKLVELTEQAEALMPPIQALGAGLRADLAQALGEAEWVSLNAGLRKIRDHLLVGRSEASRPSESTTS